MNPILFLDIDGVLNTHNRLPSGYCGIDRGHAEILNAILAAVPCKIVISSAWRYLVLRGDMTLKGFEYLLLVHGICCKDRLHGITAADPEDALEPSHFDADEWHRRGLQWRAKQILEYVCEHKIERWAVVDDLELSIPNFVRVDGLDWEYAANLITILKGEKH